MLKLRQLQERAKQQQQQQQQQQSATLLSPARIRLQRDLDALDLPSSVLSCKLLHNIKEQDKPLILQLELAPDEGYYQKGHFSFMLDFKPTYPIDPPTVRCQNRIFHPNIDINGKICLNILRESWSPALDLQSIIIGLLFLFLECNGEDPLNRQAAHYLNTDPLLFQQLVEKSMHGATIDNITYDYVL